MSRRTNPFSACRAGERGSSACCVGFFVGLGPHPDDVLAFVGVLRSPIDPGSEPAAIWTLAQDLTLGLEHAAIEIERRPAPVFFFLSLLWTFADSTTSSFSTKNLGASTRTIRSLRVTISVSACPTLVPGPIVPVLTFQVVRLSGSVNSNSAVPSGAGASAAIQNAVSAKLMRMTGSHFFVRGTSNNARTHSSEGTPGQCTPSSHKSCRGEIDRKSVVRSSLDTRSGPTISIRGAAWSSSSVFKGLMNHSFKSSRQPTGAMRAASTSKSNSAIAGDIRAARDVFDGLVIYGHHRRTGKAPRPWSLPGPEFAC